VIEHQAAPAFEDKTIGSRATKKNAVLRVSKEKKFGRRIKFVRVSYFDSRTSLYAPKKRAASASFAKRTRKIRSVRLFF